MGLFSRKKQKSETRQFFPYIEQYFNSGVFSNAEYNPIVDTVISRISNIIGILPVTLYVHTPTGDREAIWDPAFSLLKDPCVEEVASTFYKTMVRMILTKGNAYIYKFRNTRGEVIALELVDPNSVMVTRSENGMKLYNISGGSRGGVYTDRDILHIPYSDYYNGTIGKSPLQMHPEVIRKNNIISEYINVFFKNGLNSRLLVTLKDEYKVGSPKMEQLTQAFQEYFQKFVVGQENLGRPIITPPSTDISVLSVPSNAEADVLKLYEQSCAEICRLLDVPPEILFSSENKYNSLEAKNADFMINALQPLTTMIGQYLVKGLVEPEYQSSSYIQFNYAVLLETDQNKKLDYYKNAFHAGIMSLSEVRTALNLKKFEDETANNTLIVPANMMPFNEETIQAYMAKSKIALVEAEQMDNHINTGDDKQ